MKRHLARIKRIPGRSRTEVLRSIGHVKRKLRRGKRLEIEVITMMYNEAFLAPLFVRHYAPWVDKFTVFYSKSTDETLAELKAAAKQCGVKNLKIIPFEFPKGFDDMIKVDRTNRAVKESSADFVICVDADEFVHPWPFETTNPRQELARETGEVVYCNMFQSYRHATEKDIDRTQPPLFQRRHGTTDTKLHFEGAAPLPANLYTKPCIVRPDSGAEFKVGCHHLSGDRIGFTMWRGVHWGKADAFCTWRYVRDRRDRLSEENRRLNHGIQHFNETGEKLLAELKAHENSPKLF